MSNYIGVRCPVCNKKFTESDDIVVCPVCGAPHHRDCYAEKNQCAFADDHLSGKVWTDPAAQIPHQGEGGEPDVRACTRCGANNAPDNIFCSVCGQPMGADQPPQGGQPPAWGYPGYGYGQPDAISMAYGGLDPEEEISGEKVRDLAQFVGQGSAYYLPRFRIISQHKHTVSFNISALLFNFLYYFNRKMYLVGGFLLALYLIGSIPSYLYTWETLPNLLYEFNLGPAVPMPAHADNLYLLSRITQAINLFIRLGVSAFANKYYCGRVIAQVREIRSASEAAGDTHQQYNAKLAMAGGCNKTLVIVVIASLVLLSVTIGLVMGYLYMTSGL